MGPLYLQQHFPMVSLEPIILWGMLPMLGWTNFYSQLQQLKGCAWAHSFLQALLMVSLGPIKFPGCTADTLEWAYCA